MGKNSNDTDGRSFTSNGLNNIKIDYMIWSPPEIGEEIETGCVVTDIYDNGVIYDYANRNYEHFIITITSIGCEDCDEKECDCERYEYQRNVAYEFELEEEDIDNRAAQTDLTEQERERRRRRRERRRELKALGYIR